MCCTEPVRGYSSRVEPRSQVITQRTPQALRGDALREALAPLGFHDELVAPPDMEPRAPVLTPFVEVDDGPPPSTDAPRALAGDELMRVLEALRVT